MKKLLILALVLFLVPAAVHAELADLSAMSFDDLLTLRDAVNAEIKSRPEWKEVIVPAGEWVIGEDIPAGYYSLSAEKLAITQASAPDSPYNDFYHVIAAGGSVGKVLFIEGSIFKTSAPVVLALPVSLDF